MVRVQCSQCFRMIENANIIHGLTFCASCAYEQGNNPVTPKNVTSDWRAFSTVKRRRRDWR